jgi:hypothetical protein
MVPFRPGLTYCKADRRELLSWGVGWTLVSGVVRHLGWNVAPMWPRGHELGGASGVTADNRGTSLTTQEADWHADAGGEDSHKDSPAR